MYLSKQAGSVLGEDKMARVVPVTPTYASEDLGRILALEQLQVEETVADLTEEEFAWRPNEKAKSALEIVWHLAGNAVPEKPASKDEALAAFRKAHEELQHLGLIWLTERPKNLEEHISLDCSLTVNFRVLAGRHEP